ncbi:MAG: hypothetical protein JXR73_12420 [Candidatus Omnitrophica bacterium]|nr:hypothetical protein [Candidatus Omnitrophota bacterium]
MKPVRFFYTIASLIIYLFLFAGYSHAADPSGSNFRLPQEAPPVLGCWFWLERDFEAEGYRDFIDLVNEHSLYNMLTASVRAPLKEVTDKEVHDQIQRAAKYAMERGISVVMDLDVRLSRRAFQSLYPDELQQMLILREAGFVGEEDLQVEIKSRDLNDHYTSRTTHYIPLQGELMRVYSYHRNEQGVDPATLRDVTPDCRIVEQSSERVKVEIPWRPDSSGRTVCVMAAFTHLTPDVFAPHLLPFQRRILRDYQDVPLAGACKDEWGFPPCFDGNPAKDEFWYSAHRAEEYAQISGGRELLFDCLLMSKGVQGREQERIAAVNHFMKMSWRRNGAIEQDFYAAVKEILGATAVVATHPTWWPYPDSREFKKNGLDWWIAKRDWAQTDETTPFSVRTALAKKWNSPVWYNMYYNEKKSAYDSSVWTHALAGGRINYHPIYPRSGSIFERSRELLEEDLVRAESRVRLLNFISAAPLDCPVAVVFGHACAMNWAGPSYEDVGMDLVNALWRAGHPADLIPSSEIAGGYLRVMDDGWIQYGPQRYSAVVFYHPEFENSSTSRFFQQAARGRSSLFRMGEWTRDFEGKPIDGESNLPASMMKCEDIPSLASAVCRALKEKGIEPQTPAVNQLQGFAPASSCSPTEGFCRLIDGTIIWIAGRQNVSGDAIQKTFRLHGHEVKIDAVGVAAVRLDRQGRLEALAAGSLQHFQIQGCEISLNPPIDLALWRDAAGEFHGAVQNLRGPLPPSLRTITNDWIILELPSPPAD